MNKEDFFERIYEFFGDGRPDDLLAFSDREFGNIIEPLTGGELRDIGELTTWAARILELRAWERGEVLPEPEERPEDREAFRRSVAPLEAMMRERERERAAAAASPADAVPRSR